LLTEVATGRVHRFGENVTTDDVIAGKYKHESTDLDILAPHIMENIRPGFAAAIAPGDFIVAGRNFGCGSSREQAPALIKHVGISAVVAPSFARIFYRNALNLGLLVLSVETDDIEDGDILEYDADNGGVSVRDRAITRAVTPIPDDMRAIVDAGGLIAYVRKEGTL
jgi:3-isopropylmalate/(R)-2-methylmalate dehydratase small subunit